jgi:DNA-binding helix-hairpin-helix protein with protein kinase domain
LFLGRHPFAGKNKLAGDFDEETAIRKREFAYSLENKRKKLFPPNDSFSITNLSPELVTLFHRAFEQDDRPTPSDWVRALDAQLLSMVTCGVSRLHSYPSVMTDCPWCAFQKSKGIMYFLDDSYLKATAFLGDIAGFVNGFNVEKLELRSWDKQIDFSGVGPSVIEKKYYTYRTLRWGSVAALVIFAIISLALHVNPIGATLAVFLSFALYLYSPWAARLNAQLKLLSGIQTQLSDKLKAMIAEYNTPADYANYTKSLAALQKYVSDFRRLPDEFDRRRKLMEEQAYNEQLHQYLDQFTVDAHEIPSFGAAKKTTLVSHGIRTAADVSKLINTRVPGIGPKNLQVLLSWQRQMGSGFTYVPDNNLLTIRLQEVTSDMATIRSRLESLIRKEYQSLNYLRLNITNRASLLERQIIDLSILAYRASLDVAAFRRLAA